MVITIIKVQRNFLNIIHPFFNEMQLALIIEKDSVVSWDHPVKMKLLLVIKHNVYHKKSQAQELQYSKVSLVLGKLM